MKVFESNHRQLARWALGGGGYWPCRNRVAAAALVTQMRDDGLRVDWGGPTNGGLYFVWGL